MAQKIENRIRWQDRYRRRSLSNALLLTKMRSSLGTDDCALPFFLQGARLVVPRLITKPPIQRSSSKGVSREAVPKLNGYAISTGLEKYDSNLKRILCTSYSRQVPRLFLGAMACEP